MHYIAVMLFILGGFAGGRAEVARNTRNKNNLQSLAGFLSIAGIIIFIIGGFSLAWLIGIFIAGGISLGIGKSF